MSVRVKLFGAMAVLVLFMALAYFFSTQGYLRNNLPKLIPALEQEKTDAWVQLFQAYYRDHEQSWSGMDQTFPPLNPLADQQMQMILYSSAGQLLGKTQDANLAKLLNRGFKKSVLVDGRKVGYLYFYDDELAYAYQSHQDIYHEMYHVTLKAMAVLVAIALLIGLWLTHKLTSPLHRLTTAIERVGQGGLKLTLPVTSHDEYGQITQALNRMAAALAQSEEIRKHLVADVAHELRTPLTILQGQFELIQLNGQVIAPETLLPMQDEVLRLNKLVNDLLQLTLAEAGKLPLEKQKTDLTALLTRLIDRLKVHAEEKNVHIKLISSIKTTALQVDPYRITQVFYNLISNAIRYTSEGGLVTLQFTECLDTYPVEFHISIEDTGVGIPHEHLPHVFNRFYRIEDDRARHSGGMGLGLAIAKQLVEAHGGVIKVESQLGLGTKFIVILPVT